VGAAWAETTRALVATGTPVRVLRTGDRVPWFPEVSVLHPAPGWPAPSLNDGSLVLRIDAAGTSVVLAGDAELAAERAMGERLAPATVLKVPHHGSRTSSTWPFVGAIAPRVAVISVGTDNRFGHPAPEVEARYASLGARVLRTDRCGAVVVAARARDVVVTATRPECTGTSIRMRPRR